MKKTEGAERRRLVSGVRQEDAYIAIRYLHDADKYPIIKLCAVLNINRSSYYKWLKRKPSTNQLQNEEIISWIKGLYEEQNGILGYRQMTIAITRVHNTCYNKKRIRQLMQILGLQSVCRVKKKTYIPSTPETEADNVLNRDFYADVETFPEICYTEYIWIETRYNTKGGVLRESTQEAALAAVDTVHGLWHGGTCFRSRGRHRCALYQ